MSLQIVALMKEISRPPDRRGSGDLCVSECIITYDGVPTYCVSVMELLARPHVVHESETACPKADSPMDRVSPPTSAGKTELRRWKLDCAEHVEEPDRRLSEWSQGVPRWRVAEEVRPRLPKRFAERFAGHAWKRGWSGSRSGHW